MYKDINLRLFEVVSAKPPVWAHKTLEHYSPKSLLYAKSKYWCDCDSINIHDVTGTAHGDYSDNTWLNLLHLAGDGNLALLAKNPVYYHETLKVPVMEYTRIDEKTFINMEGNHRTCIARFYFDYLGLCILHGVKVEAYSIDHAFKQAHEELLKVLSRQRQFYHTEVLSTKTGKTERDDNVGWCRDYYALKLVVKKRVKSYEFSTADEIHELILDSQRPFRRQFGKFKDFWRTND